MIVLTHTGKLGDFLLALPVASWLYQRNGEKIHWVLSSDFTPFRTIESLLCLQEMTGKVTLVPHHIRHYKCGGQPYRFDPARYGINEKPYYNIGFRYLPDKYVPEFYAEAIGAGVDDGFVLNVGPARTDFAGQTVFMNDYGRLTPWVRSDWIELDARRPFPENIALALGAKEVHCGFSGFAIAVDLAGHRNIHVWKHGNPPPEPYYHRHPERIHFYRVAERIRLIEFA
jgi:hypothetical protein